ncbi:MAG: PQQ-binding-like beta-propeller repeat protein, partial [Verrucomicrobiota bacterium]
MRILITLLVLSVAVRANADWPQFKRNGPRTGDHPEARLNLPLRVVTKVKFPAPIYASPAVVGDRVYVQDARGHVACIDRTSNKVLWTRYIAGVNNCSSPAVAHGRVYIGSSLKAFYILDAITGSMIRRIEADGGVITAPAVVGDNIYFSTFNGKLVKIDPRGHAVWLLHGGRISITELAASEDRIVFFAGTDNTQQFILRDNGTTPLLLSKQPSQGQTCPTGGPVLISTNDYAYQCFDSEFGTFFLKDRILDTDVHESRATASVRGTRLYRGDKCWELSDLKPDQLKRHPQRGGRSAAQLWRADPEDLYDG